MEFQCVLKWYKRTRFIPVVASEKKIETLFLLKGNKDVIRSCLKREMGRFDQIPARVSPR